MTKDDNNNLTKEQFPGGQRGACGSSTAASSSNSTVRRVFNIGMPNLSSTASMASGSVRVIFEEIIENNVVNNVNEQNEEELVILDSGSDVSLLPKRHQRNLDETTLGCKLQNCQGGALEISGTKQAELFVQDREGQGVILQHKFIIGDVQSCIMSLGELYQAGWHIDKDGDDLSLLPPDDSMRVPVFYKNKSLAIRAHVRCVQEVQQQEEEEEADVVRAIIKLNHNFNLDRMNMWQTTTDGSPYLLTKRSRFADPRPVFGGLWNYRSTFYRKVGEGKWYIAEIGNKFMDMEEPFSVIPQISADLSDVDILTVLSKGDEPMNYLDEFWMKEELNLQWMMKMMDFMAWFNYNLVENYNLEETYMLNKTYDLKKYKVINYNKEKDMILQSHLKLKLKMRRW